MPNKKTACSQEAQLNWWKAQIGEKLLADISPSLISQYKEKLLSENTVKGKIRSPSTVVRYLAILSHVFTIASKEWGWLTDNPVRLVTKPREPKGRVRFLSDEERQNLLNACQKSKNSYLHTIVILALSTGMRLGEIVNLTWDNVDFDHQRIILEETKNGERRQVPLAGKAFELFKKLRESHFLCTKLLFPSKPYLKQPVDIRSVWDFAVKKAGIKNFRSNPGRTIMNCLFERSDGKKMRIFNSHLPGDPALPGRYEFCDYLKKHSNDEISIAMGDMNFEKSEMQEACKKQGLTDFSVVSPNDGTNVDPCKEAKVIDYMVVSGTKNIFILSAEKVFAGLGIIAALIPVNS